jgi:hypothetical protein
MDTAIESSGKQCNSYFYIEEEQQRRNSLGCLPLLQAEPTSGPSAATKYSFGLEFVPMRKSARTLYLHLPLPRPTPQGGLQDMTHARPWIPVQLLPSGSPGADHCSGALLVCIQESVRHGYSGACL